jgi:lactate dehydrogenase-like 2-hydroxyacid dehydrogenase
MDSKSRVLVSVGRLNFPGDVAETLKPLAEVVYTTTRSYEGLLQGAKAVIAGVEAVDEGYLSGAPNLGLVARFGVGYDSVDVEACTRRRVYVTHTPGVLSGGVAEHTWALILGLMRRIPEADRFTREEWALGRGGLPLRQGRRGEDPWHRRAGEDREGGREEGYRLRSRAHLLRHS